MSLASDKIERCSAQMLLRFPWWASLYLHLIRVETEAGGINTMAVDGTHLFFNPKFTESLTDKECIGVLMHETAHCAFLHCYRRKYREPERWNIACDKAVNAILIASNIALPKDLCSTWSTRHARRRIVREDYAGRNGICTAVT